MRFILKRVKLDDICFKYNERANYLHKNISLEIGHKGSLGVMGKSGSGKTTLIEILMTLMRPTSGRLLINNIDVWTNDDLRLEFRRNIYYVSQSVFFPDVAFGEIITGNKDPSKWNSYELKKCVELVGIEKIVSAENGGFERSMGENACMLSGGERQRISIAKALYRKSQLIILDEPTSSLDSYSEELVINAIKEMQRFSSTVIISHRIGPLELCDNVYDLSSDTGIYV
jgi:ABC-type bacteriocin/lantibiotic exporter with double-glycine peptidase domain